MPLSLSNIMRLSVIHKSLRILSLAALAVTAPLLAQVRELPPVVETIDRKVLSVSVSGSTSELNNLARFAFNAHGRYKLADKSSLQLKFTQVSGNQVQVTVTKGGAVMFNQISQGTSLRNALFRAADLAVKQTSGLEGFFASKLAFISEYTGKPEVFTGDLFFGEVRRITSDGGQAITPRWSPDGSKLLYTSFHRSGYPDIFLLDLNSMQRSTFVSFKGTNSGARFSPDGSRVAMVLTGEGNPEIYVGSAQGRGISRRTRTPAVEASPAWSPDGTRLVFTSDSAGGPQLYVMPAGGGSPQRLQTNISGYCAEPDWSKADPNKIAFTVRIGRGFQIAVYDMASRTTKVVSKAPVDAVEPSWLADGRHLVYTERAANTRRICLLDTESGKSTPLSPTQLRQTSQASVWLR